MTDAESRTTEYVLDDLGRTVRVTSPDTGITRFTFDAAGNLLSKSDANGITSTYAYDDEYRLTGISYPDSSQNVTYTYDQGANGKARLTGMSDVSGSQKTRLWQINRRIRRATCQKPQLQRQLARERLRSSRGSASLR